MKKKLGIAALGIGLLSGGGLFWSNFNSTHAAEVTVYKSPTCGCCTKWEEHLEENGFSVESRPTSDLQEVKSKYQVPARLGGCHTGVVDGYVIEGHVPADVIERFLSERPEGAAGLSVPGMPVGSPGMEGPNRQPYEVVLFRKDGTQSVYERR